MGPLFSAGFIVLTALIAMAVGFAVARVFVPTREALGWAFAIVVPGEAGAAVAVLALASFFTNENLATTKSVLGYLGTVAASAILCSVAGATAYRKRGAN